MLTGIHAKVDVHQDRLKDVMSGIEDSYKLTCEIVCVCVRVCVHACVHVCVCVCERERERERSCLAVTRQYFILCEEFLRSKLKLLIAKHFEY